MTGLYEFDARDLVPLIGTPSCPRLIDVRTDEDFARDPRLIPGALRYTHLQAAETSGRTAVIICQKGLKLSHGAAASIRSTGHMAFALSGGWLAWRKLHDAPIRTVGDTGKVGHWVTGPLSGAPQRLAAIWLVRRFADRDARILCVPESEISDVANRFSAVAFAPDPSTGFSATLRRFGLATQALSAMAQSFETGAGSGDLLESLSFLHDNENDLIEAALPICDAIHATGAAG